MKNIKWANEEIKKERNLLNDKRYEREVDDLTTGVLLGLKKALNILDQLDEPEVLSQEWMNGNSVYASSDGVTEEYVHVDDLKELLVPKKEEVDLAYRKGFKEGERQTAEYFESITEEPSYEQVQKYLSEHGIEVVEKEPETVADVIADFFKSLERLKEVMSMEVEELGK